MMETSDMEMSLMLVSLRRSSKTKVLCRRFLFFSFFPNKMTNKEVSGDNDKYIEMTGIKRSYSDSLSSLQWSQVD